METWKRIPSFPRYEVSSLGSVRSTAEVRGGPKLLALNATEYYLRACLFKDGNKYTKRVHLLVCEAFHGTRPEGKVCRHKDGNRCNNRPENLEWATQKDNIEDKKKHGTYTQGAANHRAKLTDAQVAEIRADPRYRYKPEEYAAKFGVSKGCVVDARVGRTFTHLKKIKL